MERDAEFQEFAAGRMASMLRLAYLLCLDQHAAHDLVQLALVRTYVRWRQIRTNPEAYVRRVLVTVAADERRRAHHRHELPYGELPERADGRGDIAQLELRAHLRTALATLPPRQRAALVLRYWLGLDAAEAGEMLGCSAVTVRTQASRGLEKLRALLADEEVALES